MNKAVQDRAGDGVRPHAGWRAALATTLAIGAGVVSVASPIGVSPVAALPPTPVLTGDINQNGRGSAIASMVEIGGVLFFTADDGVHGAELWRYDGVTAPVMVTDLNADGPSAPTDLTDVGGTLYFTADDGGTGREPYALDPTSAAALPVLVADLAAGAASSSPAQFVAADGRAWFVADDGLGGAQLFRTDSIATPLTASLVEPVALGGSIAAPAELTSVTHPGVGDVVWMVADVTGAVGAEVVGIDPVGDLHTLSIDAGPEDLTVAGDVLYYNDGSLVQVDVLPGVPNEFPTVSVGADVIDLATAGGIVYATAIAGLDIELHRLDAGALDPIGPGLAFPNTFASAGNALYFRADDGTGEELWRTTGGTPTRVLDVNPNAAQPGVFAGPWAAGDNAYFVGSDDVSLELYVSTPTAAFQIPGLDIFLDTDIGGFVPFDGAVHFFGDPGPIGVELLSTPLAPIAAGDNVDTVADLVTGTESSLPDSVGAARDRIVWSATDDANINALDAEFEPYVYDPTSGLVGVLKDINPGAGSSNPVAFTRFGDLTLFQADDGSHGAELWVTDGTGAGTTMLADLDPGSTVAGPNSSFPDFFTVVGDSVFFVAQGAFTGFELWKTDGTTAGTVLVKDIRPAVGVGSDPTDLVEMGGALYFVATGPGGAQLWRSDGTTAGTVVVGTATNVSNLVAADAYLVFTVDDGGEEPWVSYGTAGSTGPLQEVGATPAAFAPRRYTRVGNEIYFFAQNSATGWEGVWRTDGTSTGTAMIFSGEFFFLDLGQDPGIPAIAPAGASGDILFAATANVGAGDYALWQSDGTAVGTAPVADGYNLPVASATLNGWTYFTAVTPTTGRELWRTDGTTVEQVSSFGGAADGAGTDGLWPVGDRVFFPGITPAAGTELFYVEDAPPVPAAPAAPTAAAGVGSATVTWAPVADVPFAPVTGYVVTASPGGATCAGDETDTSCTVTGLTGGTPYTFTVRSTNRIGSSSASPASNAVTPPSAPSTPAAPTATAGLLSASVSWTAVANPAGAPVTGYTVTATPGSGTCTTSGATTCTVTNLVAGTPYTFRVKATNVVGDSGLSPASNSVTPTSPAIPPSPSAPAAPAAPTASAKVRSALVSWTAVADPVGAPVTGYTVTAAPGGATCTSGTTSCTVNGLTAGTSYTFTVVATNSAGNSPASPPSGAVVPVPPAGVPLTPARLLDTRVGPEFTTADGQSQGVGRLEAGSTYELLVTGRADVPAGADAVMLNVTAVQPDSDGFLTVFPCGADRPGTSSVNYRAGEVVPNAVLAKIGTDGKVCIFTLAASHVLVDVNGYVPAGGSPSTVVPARILETRTGDGLVTVDQQAQGIGRVSAGITLELQVAGRAGVPGDAEAVMLNVTAVLPSADGFLTVFPCGADRPGTSSVNYRAGEVVPNAVLAKIGAGGKVCIYTLADVDLLVDVSGFVPAGGAPTTVLPARLLETRSGTGFVTVDGQEQGVGRREAGTTYELQVTGRGNVPANATAVMLNVTAVLPSDGGFLTVFPCGSDRPQASSVNYGPGEVVPNAVLAKIGTGGKVCIYTLQATDLLVDVNASIVPV